MNEIIAMIAAALAKNGQVIGVSGNSIFSAIELGDGSEQDLNVMANKIATKINNELIFIKGKMLPLMGDYVEVINKKLSEFKMPSELSKFKIVEVTIPDLFYELKDTNVITSKRPVGALPIASVIVPTPKIDEVRSFFKHPVARLDALVEEVLVKYTNEDLIKVWDKYLLNVSQSNTNIENISYGIMGKLDELVMLYAVVSNIKNSRPAGVRVSEDTYKNVMEQFNLELLNYISIAIEEKAKIKNIKKLVIAKRSDYELLVEKELYDNFIKDGNSPEVLLGMLLSGEITFEKMLVNSIIENAVRYKSAWEKKVKLNAVEAKSREIDKFKATYSITLKALYEEVIPSDLKDYVKVDLATAEKALLELYKELKESEIVDVDVMAKDILGLIVFSNTNFYAFTNYMLEHTKLHSGISSKEAASLAMVDLILDYLLQQINTEAIK
jgi:hypothetical protein